MNSVKNVGRNILKGMVLASFLLATVFVFHKVEAAGEPYGLAGCGAGTQIFGPREWQISASTTNHGSLSIPMDASYLLIPSSQPWSITFDLAGCGENAQPISYFDQYNFMFHNFAALAKEAAQGEGEMIDGLAGTFGCEEDHLPQFRNFVRENYRQIFAQPGVRAAFLEVRSQIQSDQNLIDACPLAMES